MTPTALASRNLSNARRATADVEHLRACLEVASRLPKAKRRTSLDGLRARLSKAEAAAARYLELATTPAESE